MKWSVVMPVYNEAAIIETVVRSFEEKVLSRLSDSEFILVDDASKDQTPAILDRLAKEFKNIRVIHAAKNGGHGRALLTGYREAAGDAVFHCDSDNQHDPMDFWKLEPHLAEADVVIGVREERNDPVSRQVISRINRLLCRLLFNSPLKDHNSPFKIHHRRALGEILAIVAAREPFAPSIHMAIAAQALDLKIREIPIRHLPRLTGTISIVRWKLLKVCLRTACELWTLRWVLWSRRRA